MARIRLTIDLDTKYGDISEETLEAIGAVNLRNLMMDALREFQVSRRVSAEPNHLNLESARAYVEARYTHETPKGEVCTYGEWGSEAFERKALEVARRAHVAEFIANHIDQIGFDKPDDSTSNVVENLAEALNHTGLNQKDFGRAHDLLRLARLRSRKEHFPYMRKEDRDVLLLNLRRFMEYRVEECDTPMPTNQNYHRHLVGNVIKWVENREPTSTKVEK